MSSELLVGFVFLLALFISFGLQYKGLIEKSVVNKSLNFKSVVVSTLQSTGKEGNIDFSRNQPLGNEITF